MKPGDVIGNYRVDEVIGRGAVAVVYRARHLVLDTVHALKVLRIDDEELRERLVREGRAQAALRHANVVRVTDVVEADGRPCLVMDFVPGPSLADLLRRVRPTEAEVERIFRGIVRGVAAAHRAGIAHRDLKPSNVLLDRRVTPSEPRVVDFGIARALEVSQGTLAGRVLGTPGYMAPEQLLGASDIGASVDVFALGVLLVEMWTGHLPYPYEDPAGWLAQVSEQTWLAPTDGSPRLGSVARACLAFDPAARPHDGDAVLALLQAPTAASDPPVRPTSVEAVRHPPGAESARSHPASDPATPAVSESPRPVFGRALLAGGLGGVAGLVVGGLLVAALWSQPNEGGSSLIDGLELRAWRAAGERPAEALALLRAVAQERGETLPQEVVADLILAGAASQVLPVDGPGVAVALDGDHLAASTIEGRVRVWSASSGELLATIETGIFQPRGLRLLDGGRAFTLHPHDGLGRADTDAVIWAIPGGEPRLRDAARDAQPVVPLGESDVLLVRRAGDRASALRLDFAGEARWSVDLGARIGGEWSANDHLVAMQAGDRLLVLRSDDGAVLHDRPLLSRASVVAAAPSGESVLIGAVDGAYRWTPDSAMETVRTSARIGGLAYAPSDRGFTLFGAGWRHAEAFDADARPRARLDVGRGPLTHVAYIDDATLALAARDGALSVHATTGARLAVLRGHRGRLAAVAVDGGRLATVSLDRSVRLWRQPAEVLGVGQRRDAPWAASEAEGQAIGDTFVEIVGASLRAWSPLDGRASEFPLPITGAFTIGGDPAGRAFLVKGANAETWVRDASGQARLTRTLPSIGWLAIGPAHGELLVANRDRIALYDDAGAEIAGGPLGGADPRVAWVRGGTAFVVGHGPVGWLDLWTIDPPARVARMEAGLVGQRGVSAIASSPDGEVVVAGFYGGGVVAWRLADDARQPLGVLGEDPLRVATDGRRVAAVTRDGELAIWDLAGPTLIERRPLRHAPSALRFVGEALVIGDVAGHVSWWEDGGLVERPAHAGPVRVLAPDPAGDVLWSAGDDGIAWAWPELGRGLGAFDLAKTGALTNLRVCPDDGRVVAVVPWPQPETVWAPAAACAGE